MQTTLFSAVAFFSAVQAPAQSPTTSMAVALQPGDLGEAEVAALEDALTTAADELFDSPVAGPGDVAEIAEENPELSACDSVFCWSRVARELSVGLVLIARIATAGDKLLISLRLIDATSERTVVRHQAPIRNDVLTFAADCRTLVQSLRPELPVALRPALRGAAPTAASPPAPKPIPPPVPAAPPEPVQLADSALDNPGWLGVKHVSIDFEEAQRIGLSPPLGAQIVKVAPDGSAAAAGLRVGDVIIDYGGHPVKSRTDLIRLTRRTPSGTRVPITVWRDGAAIEMQTHMVARGQTAATPAPEPPPESVATPAPAEPRTVTDEDFDVSDTGFSYSRDEVTEVTEPVDSATFVTWSLSGVYIDMSPEGSDLSSTAFGGGVGVGFRYLDPFGEFPAADEPGGGRHCLTFSASGVVSLIHVQIEIPDTTGLIGDTSFSSNSVYMEFGALAGYTFLYFGAFDPETLKQPGWGITLGAQVGATRILNTEEGAPPTEFEPFVRPAFGLEFPSYNPGTGEVTSFNVMGFIYPKSEMFTAVLALGGSF